MGDAGPRDPGVPRSRHRPAEPILFVIFGATGDLSRRKLLPSLYNLAVQELLPERFTLVGAAREGLSREQFQALAETAIREHSRLQPVDDGILWRLLHLLDYESVDLYDEVGFRRLSRKLDEMERERRRRIGSTTARRPRQYSAPLSGRWRSQALPEPASLASAGSSSRSRTAPVLDLLGS